MTRTWTTGQKCVEVSFYCALFNFAFCPFRRFVDDTGNSLKAQDPTNNNDIENNDGNGGNAPAPAAPDKHFEDQATQTEDEDDCGDEDSYCSYNEYSEFNQNQLHIGLTL